jgi:hypothetical protein
MIASENSKSEEEGKEGKKGNDAKVRMRCRMRTGRGKGSSLRSRLRRPCLARPDAAGGMGLERQDSAKRNNKMLVVIRGLWIAGGTVLGAATDADPADENYAMRLAGIAAATGIRCERFRPFGGVKDWNDSIRKQYG